MGNTCVHIAAQASALDSLTYLIDDLKMNANCLNNIGMTPLHSACKVLISDFIILFVYLRSIIFYRIIEKRLLNFY